MRLSQHQQPLRGGGGQDQDRGEEVCQDDRSVLTGVGRGAGQRSHGLSVQLVLPGGRHSRSHRQPRHPHSPVKPHDAVQRHPVSRGQDEEGPE